MQKVKFKIGGMHCRSCAIVLEGKLKETPGVIRAKVDFESQKGVAIFDENRIHKNQIHAVIAETSEYTAEELNDQISEEPVSADGHRHNDLASSENRTVAPQTPSNGQFAVGLIVGLAIVSSIFNIVFVVKLFSLSSNASGSRPVLAAQAPSAPTLQPSVPSAPTIQTFEVTKADHVRGDFNAPITLVEFSDFECPFCERHYPTLKKLLGDYAGRVRLVYKHFPLSFHPNSQKAAEASECADEQERFWEYHDKMFENQTSGYSVDKFKQWAVEIGLNTQRFNNCLDSGKYAQKVQSDSQEGAQKGVNGTPATFVNGQLVSGAVPYDAFKQIIDQLLSQ